MTEQRFKSIVTAIAFFAAVTTWTAAGYLTGLTKGRGWRAAVQNCQMSCPL